MQPCDLMRQGQSQPHAAGDIVQGHGPHMPAKQHFLPVGRNAAAGILHLDEHMGLLHGQRHRHLSTGGAGLQRIGQQLPQGLAQPRLVDSGDGVTLLAHHLQLHALQLKGDLRLPDDLIQPHLQVRVFGGQQLLAVQHRGGLQVLCQPQQPEIAMVEHGGVRVQYRILVPFIGGGQLLHPIVDIAQCGPYLHRHQRQPLHVYLFLLCLFHETSLLLLSAYQFPGAINRANFCQLVHIISNAVQEYKIFIKFPRNEKKFQKRLAFCGTTAYNSKHTIHLGYSIREEDVL